MRILKAFYKGELHPAEDIVSHDPAYCLIEDKIEEGMERLQEKFSQEDKAFFEDWYGLLLESLAMDHVAHFSYGFQLGAQVMCEVFMGEDGPRV